MSYRELRDFTEHMKTLGYPTSLSHASFRQPNFPLVASCLLFLLRRYDPSLITADDISTQQARITFIQSITQLLWSKCNVKLSMKQLYRADGYAVKEMLKLSAVLYAAMAANGNTTAGGGSGSTAASTSPSAADGAAGVPASLDAFKAAKSLATALIDTADRLSELLGREAAVRVARDTAIAFVDQLNETSGSSTAGGSGSSSSSNNVERHIKRQLQLIADNTAELKQLTATTTADVDKQSTKLDRKQQERDRLAKRWQALRRVKPAFMDEYEREEKELRTLYSVYVERVRNVRWLEDEMREMREEEEEERKERERQRAKVQKRMKEEERRMLRGEGEDDDDDGSGDDDEEEDDDDDDGNERDEKRMQYERKDRAGDDEDEEDGEEGDEGEEEDDDDELDSENEHKRPARRPPQKQPTNAAIMRGRDNRVGGGGGGGGSGGGAKGRPAGRSNEMDMGSESEGSAMGDDDYF